MLEAKYIFLCIFLNAFGMFVLDKIPFNLVEIPVLKGNEPGGGEKGMTKPSLGLLNLRWQNNRWSIIFISLNLRTEEKTFAPKNASPEVISKSFSLCKGGKSSPMSRWDKDLTVSDFYDKWATSCHNTSQSSQEPPSNFWSRWCSR